MPRYLRYNGVPLTSIRSGTQGVAIDDLYTFGTTKLYPIGARWLDDSDGRVFRHVKASGTLNNDLLCQTVTAQHIAFAAAPVAAAAGDTQLSVTVAATDGAAAGGIVALNELEGGYVVIFSDSVATMTRQIVGNTAVGANGGTTVLDLQHKLNVAVATADSYIEAMASPYAVVKASTTGDANRGFVGLPNCMATTGTYCWIQTWGPCWVAPRGAVGNSGHSIQVVARYDGSLQVHEVYTAGDTPTATEYTNGVEQQHVGFVLTHATAGTQGAPFVMLQISC